MNWSRFIDGALAAVLIFILANRDLAKKGGVLGYVSDSLCRPYIFRGWHSWPVTEGTVETAESYVFYRGRYCVEVWYSYAVDGSYYSGRDERDFSSKTEAEGYAANIRGQKVAIRVSPNNPQRSRFDQAPVSLS